MFANKWKRILLVASVIAIAACQPEAPVQGQSVGGGKALTSGFTLSQAEFDRLSKEDQYMVANKVLSTMYRGLPLDEFFDLTQGLDSPQVQYSNFISDTQVRLQTKLSSSELTLVSADVFGQEDLPATENVDESIPAQFDRLDSTEHPHQITMARILGYPLSKDMFVQWMSYFLANTIMFSPAREMDSSDEQDILRTLSYLEQSLAANTPVRDVVRGWLHNLSRWRVSRSAENHALEMFELYLGQFNDTPEQQEDTLNGGIACAPWYLTDNQGGYQLLKDPMMVEGAKTVKVLNSYISTCDELYDLVAGQPVVISRVTEVIAYYFLDGASSEVRQALIQDIVNSGANTFEDIFLKIMFSKAFLLSSERAKTFEENAFGFLGSMHYTSRAESFPLDRRVIDRVWDSSNNGGSYAVHNMGWAAMDYKIGRIPAIPMDALSFATYHKGIRESFLMNNRAFDGRNHPEAEDFTEADVPREPPFEIQDGAFYVAGTENLKPELEGLMPNEFIDLVFLTAMGRRATQAEQDALIAEGVIREYLQEYEIEGEEVLQLRRRSVGDGGDYYEYWVDDFAEIMLDYISRLPEFYYYRSVAS